MMNEEAKKVWRAKLSLAQYRNLGYLSQPGAGGVGFCQHCETVQWAESYSTRKWTLYVTDCRECGQGTFKAMPVGKRVKLAASKRKRMYGRQAEAIRVETESLFAVAG